MEIHPDPRVLTELNWNNQAVKEVEERGREALPGSKYRASKTLAERGKQYTCISSPWGLSQALDSCMGIPLKK